MPEEEAFLIVKFIHPAIFTPFWYISLFIENRGSSENLGFYSIAIMNGAGLVGRVFSGYMADRVGRFNTLVALAFLQAISVLAVWTTSTTISETLVFAVLYVSLVLIVSFMQT